MTWSLSTYKVVFIANAYFCSKMFLFLCMPMLSKYKIPERALHLLVDIWTCMLQCKTCSNDHCTLRHFRVTSYFNALDCSLQKAAESIWVKAEINRSISMVTFRSSIVRSVAPSCGDFEVQTYSNVLVFFLSLAATSDWLTSEIKIRSLPKRNTS